MRRKYLFLILAMLPGMINLFAQYDAKLFKKLSHNLQTASSDVQRIVAMRAVGDYYVEQSYMEGYQKAMDTAYSYARACEQLARKIKSDKEMAYTWLLFSKAYNYESKYDTCIDYAQKAIDAFTALKDDVGLCHARRTMYRALRYTKAATELKPYMEQSVALALKTKDNMLCGIAYEDYAQNEQIGGFIVQALDGMNKAIHFYQLAGRKELQHCFAQQAKLNLNLQKLPEAYASIIKAVSLAELFDDKSYDMIDLYHFASDIYIAVQQWETCEVFTRKALKIARRYIDPIAILNEAIDLQLVLRHNGKLNEAMEVGTVIEKTYPLCSVYNQLKGLGTLIRLTVFAHNYDKADKYYKAITPLLPFIHPEKTGGDPAVTVGHGLAFYFIHKKNADSAQKYLDMMVSGLNVYRDTFYVVEYKPVVHHIQFYIDSLRGNYIHAIQQLHLYEFYNDSLFNLRKNGQIAEMDAKYELEKKRKDNELLKRERELQSARAAKATSQKNWSLAAVLLLAVIVALVARQYRVNQKSRLEIAFKNKTLEQLITEKDELLEEKDWLLKEIHHRVKNNLQMVMSLLNTQSYFLSDEAAKEAIMNSQHRIHSMSLIHKKLYQSESVSAIDVAVYFSELAEYYKAAFDTGNRILFQLDVDRIELDASQAVPIGLILNEAINNSLKHAFPEGRSGVITIRFKNIENNQLLFSVKDNGVGVTDAVAGAGYDSLGMKLIKGFSGDLEADLEIISDNGMEITLRFKNSRLADEPIHS